MRAVSVSDMWAPGGVCQITLHFTGWQTVDFNLFRRGLPLRVEVLVMPTPFEYEFDFQTFVDTDDMPVSQSLRLNVRRIGNTMIEMSTQSDGRVFKVVMTLGITDDGKTCVAVEAIKPGVGADGRLDEFAKGQVTKTIVDGTVDADGFYSPRSA